MIEFKVTAADVELHYEGELRGNNEWVWNDLKSHGQVRLSRVFFFELGDLLNPPAPAQDLDGYVYHFKFGALDSDYVRIAGRILDINNDLLISAYSSQTQHLFQFKSATCSDSNPPLSPIQNCHLLATQSVELALEVTLRDMHAQATARLRRWVCWAR